MTSTYRPSSGGSARKGTFKALKLAFGGFFNTEIRINRIDRIIMKVYNNYSIKIHIKAIIHC